ncbi:hypothetical protein BH11PSE10_BH11PSE10_07640 [soil metagenome]
MGLPLLLVLAIHLFSQQYRTALPPQVVRFDQAKIQYGDTAAPPALEALTQQRLPLQTTAADTPGPLWFHIDFTLAAAADQPFWLSLQHRPAAAVFLDGQLLAQSGQGGGQAADDEGDLALRGLLLAGRRLQVSVPPALLEAGSHRLGVRLMREASESAGLSAVLLGPAVQMRALQEGRQLWQGLRVLTVLAGLILGLFMLLVWLALRQEWLNGVTGLYCLLAALLLSPYLLNGALLPAPWWRVVLDLADVLSKALMLFLVARLSAWPQTWPTRLVLGYLALALPIDGWAAYRGYSWTDFSQLWPWWALASRALILIAAAGLACWAALRSGRRAHAVGAGAVALSAWIWAYVSYFFLLAPQTLAAVDVNVLGYAVLIALAGVALQRRFVASLRAQARARSELEQALALRTQELQARWQQLQVSEQQRGVAQERERLLQEMHDGLGSQLLMARLGAERGVDPKELVSLLNDCLDEMRLTVDALAVPNGDLTLLLANLRHRLGSRLSAAGLVLDWQLGDVPLVPCLAGTGGRELVRIVQEALSNIVQHARASRVRFTTRVEAGGQTVSLVIADNGCGMPVELRQGQGLCNMRKRAQRIGAAISWATPYGASESHQPGTELRLLLPFKALSPNSGASAISQNQGIRLET